MQFTFLMLYFSQIFGLMYLTTKIDGPGGDDYHANEDGKNHDDYPNRTYFERIFMFAFANTVGNIQFPEFSEWTSAEMTKENPYSSASMVILTLAIHHIQIIFMVIIMLNLLISRVGDMYDRMRETQDTTRFIE